LAPKEEKQKNVLKAIETKKEAEKLINDDENDMVLQAQNNQEIITVKPMPIKKLLEKKLSLLSHMDSIRGLTFIEKYGVLASISEDCLVKLWNLKDMKPEEFEPYYTLRGHTAPLFTICQNKQNSSESLIYTAGAEGHIRVWEIPSPSTIVPYSKTDGKNFCVGIWKAHEEPIWQLLTHPTNDFLLSVSADSTIALWKILTTAQNIEKMSKEIQDKPIKTYQCNGPKKEGVLIPTCASFVPSNLSSFIAGYKTPYLVYYDLQNVFL